MTHPLFEIVTTVTGVVSIRNKSVDEIMHNPVGPWIEANSLYVDQSGLRARLENGSSEEMVIFDVGLGAAANALAVLACARSVRQRPVRLISFERDLELLRFALSHASHFDHFKGSEEALAQILRRGVWVEKGFHWELREGNFLDKIEEETHRPHLIFFDPYSPKVNQEMWTTGCFEKLRRRCREAAEGGSTFYTYSRATRIRAALLKAGFFVGYGSATGLKTETTQASTDRTLLKAPLDKAWFDRWENSHARYPFDCELDGQEAMDDFVRAAAAKSRRTPV